MHDDVTFLRDALREAARDPGDGVHVVVVPVATRARHLSLDGLRLRWCPPEGPSIAGRGVALSLTGSSLEALRAPAERALSTVRVSVHPSAAWCPPPRLYGAQTFDPRHSQRDDVAWGAFPAASLTLPFASLMRHGEHAALALAFDRDARRGFDRALERALQALASIVESVTPAAAPRTHAPRSNDRDRWNALVADALSCFARGDADKLVAARRAELRADAPWRSEIVCDALVASSRERSDTACFVFEHGDSAFVGATPERLVSLRGDLVEADALAGTSARDADDALDRARIDALRAAQKEGREHALVVQGIRDALAPYCAAVDAPAAPRVRTLRHVHHLWTPVRARLAAPAHVLSLVTALHPTPALGGAPRAFALDWIAAHEDCPRGWYASPVGWCDARGDGEFFAAIRSAVLRGSRAWIYAGAGLVAGSDPALEWHETEAKMAPMRAALRGDA